MPLVLICTGFRLNCFTTINPKLRGQTLNGKTALYPCFGALGVNLVGVDAGKENGPRLKYGPRGLLLVFKFDPFLAADIGLLLVADH